MSKKYGFIFADEMEYTPFRDIALQEGGHDVEGILPMVTVDRGGDTILAIHCGIGKVNAAIAASFLVQSCGVDVLLSAGLSGAISKLHKGDVVAGATYVECDFDLSAFGYEVGHKTDGTYLHKGDETLLKAAVSVPGIRAGALGTGDFFLNDPATKEKFKEIFGINAFDMETASIASVADAFDVPFLSVRKISDDADDSATDSYTEMNDLAEEDLSRILLDIVDRLD